MRLLILLSFVVLATLSTCCAYDMSVGTSYNSRLIWQQKANYASIPFRKRVKEVFYSNPANLIIKGIIARDLERTEGSATITAGGVGFSYVNIRLKSARGHGLNYQIEIYV